jgi:prepilin-type processing-associated H-X9-DG protein
MLSRLYTLLLVFLVAWSSWVIFRPLAILEPLSILFVYIFVFGSVLAMAASWKAFLVFVPCSLLLIGLLLPAIPTPHDAARLGQCMNNLRGINLALHSYECQYKCFPPPFVADENGNPMHSWRVLILPYMDGQDLYEAYDFNEPWDGPNNKKLLTRQPKLYTCPDDKSAYEPGATSTSYLAVVGANAAWRSDRPTSLSNPETSDQASNTILLVEKSNSGIQWTEPKDFCLDDLVSGTSQEAVPPIQSAHQWRHGYFYHNTPGINVAFADGHVDFLPIDNFAVSNLKSVLAIGGCKDEEGLRPLIRKDDLRINWPNCIALPAWFVSVVLLLHQAVRSRKTARQRVAESTN